MNKNPTPELIKTLPRNLSHGFPAATTPQIHFPAPEAEGLLFLQSSSPDPAQGLPQPGLGCCSSARAQQDPAAWRHSHLYREALWINNRAGNML